MSNTTTHTIFKAEHERLRILLFCILATTIIGCNKSNHEHSDKIILNKAYYKNGKIMSLYRTHNGKKQGIEKTFYDNGFVKSIIYWRNNSAHGVIKEFDRQGILVQESSYKEGMLNGVTTFYDNGSIKEKHVYRNGDIVEATVKAGNKFKLHLFPFFEDIKYNSKQKEILYTKVMFTRKLSNNTLMIIGKLNRLGEVIDTNTVLRYDNMFIVKKSIYNEKDYIQYKFVNNVDSTINETFGTHTFDFN